MNIHILEADNVASVYDPVKNIVVVIYQGTLNPNTFLNSLQWLHHHLDDLEHVTTVYLDFQDVTHFGVVDFLSSSALHESQQLLQLLEHLPIVYLVNDAYQERLLQRLLDVLLPAVNSTSVVLGWNGALAIATPDTQKTQPAMSISTLNLPHVSGYYDEDKQIIHTRYYGVITTNTMVEMFQWVHVIYEVYRLENCRGRICDFRSVTSFLPPRQMQLRQVYQNLDNAFNISRLPVAMVASNQRQANIVYSGLQLASEDIGVAKIVNGLNDAYQYIDGFKGKSAQS